jgi:CBS domain-containing protein
MATIVEQLLLHKGNQVHCVDPNAKVRDAVELLGERLIGAVLVCRNNRVLGIVSERDCTREVLWRGSCTLDTPVSELMRSEVVTVSRNDSLDYCMSLMNDRRIRHLPVVEDGELVGVISIGDVINSLLREQQSLIESLESYISGSPSVRPPAH